MRRGGQGRVGRGDQVEIKEKTRHLSEEVAVAERDDVAALLRRDDGLASLDDVKGVAAVRSWADRGERSRRAQAEVEWSSGGDRGGRSDGEIKGSSGGDQWSSGGVRMGRSQGKLCTSPAPR